MGVGRRRPLRCVEGPGQLLELLALHGLAQLREEVTLLLFHVVADVLDQHRHLGREALVGGVHAVEFGKHPLHDVVLLEGLEDLVGGVGHRLAGRRVEHLLLDGGVDRQLLDDLLDEILLGLVGVRARLLELLEQRLDGLVVVPEQRYGVHVPVPSRPECP